MFYLYNPLTNGIHWRTLLASEVSNSWEGVRDVMARGACALCGLLQGVHPALDGLTICLILFDWMRTKPGCSKAEGCYSLEGQNYIARGNGMIWDERRLTQRWG